MKGRFKSNWYYLALSSPMNNKITLTACFTSGQDTRVGSASLGRKKKEAVKESFALTQPSRYKEPEPEVVKAYEQY